MMVNLVLLVSLLHLCLAERPRLEVGFDEQELLGDAAQVREIYVHQGVKFRDERVQLKPGESVGMLAITLNEGTMGIPGVQSLVRDVLTRVVQEEHHLVVIAGQEVADFWVPEVDDWEVYRTTHPLDGSFKLQTFIFTRNGLAIRTKALTPAQLEVAPKFQTFADPGAPGCTRGQPGSAGCWSHGIFVNCKVPDPLPYTQRICTKGTMVTIMEIYQSSETDDGSGDIMDVMSARASSGWLVVTNSHFGQVRDPLEEKMVQRAAELVPVMKLLQQATGSFQIPVLMMGDWNFRFSNAAGIHTALSKKSKSLASYFWTDFEYVGSAIAPDQSEKMHLIWQRPYDEDISIPGLKRGLVKTQMLYDEVAVALGLMAALQPWLDHDSEVQVPAEFAGFATLVEHGFLFNDEKLPCTCRYNEKATTRKPIGVDLHFRVEADAYTGVLDPLIYTDESWQEFKDKDYIIAKTELKKGTKIIRAPSKCDRMAFTAGHFDTTALEMVWGVGYLDHELFPILLKTDHLALDGGFTITLHEKVKGQELLSLLAPAKGAHMSCCCRKSDTEGHIDRNGCMWVATDCKDEDVNVVGIEDGLTTIRFAADGVTDEQRMCESLFGELSETYDGSGLHWVKRVK